MKTFSRLSIIFFLVIILAGTASAKPRLAVRPFADKTQEQDAPVEAITDMMVTELSKTGVFNLLERERLDYIGEEIRLGQSGLVDMETAPKLGKIKGAEYTMTGAVTLYYYNETAKSSVLPVLRTKAAAKTAYVLLEIRIIDNTTGEVVYAADQLGSSTQETKSSPGRFSTTYGGILASATRNSVVKHASAIRSRYWN